MKRKSKWEELSERASGNWAALYANPAARLAEKTLPTMLHQLYQERNALWADWQWQNPRLVKERRALSRQINDCWISISDGRKATLPLPMKNEASNRAL